MATDRRHYPREQAILAVDYSMSEEIPNLFYVTPDISPIGVFIKTPRPLNIGSRLELVFSLESSSDALDSENRVQVSGVVTHARSSGHEAGMGIRFEGLSETDWQRIRSFIRKRGKGHLGPANTTDMHLRLKAIEQQSAELRKDLDDLNRGHD